MKRHFFSLAGLTSYLETASGLSSRQTHSVKKGGKEQDQEADRMFSVPLVFLAQLWGLMTSDVMAASHNSVVTLNYCNSPLSIPKSPVHLLPVSLALP